MNFTTIFRSVSLQIAIFSEQQHIHRASPVQQVAKICAAFEAFYLSYLVGRLMIFNPPSPFPSRSFWFHLPLLLAFYGCHFSYLRCERISNATIPVLFLRLQQLVVVVAAAVDVVAVKSINYADI